MVRKNILIVGGSSGLGAAIAIGHATQGDNIFVAARRDQRIKALSRDDFSGTWTSIKLDLLDQCSTARLVNKCPQPDIIYLCAGVHDSTPIEKLMIINFIRLVEIARQFDFKNTKIVFISSLAAVVSFPNLAAYCSSKSAIESWVKAAAEESDSTMIIIRPGQFYSEFFLDCKDKNLVDLPQDIANKVIDIVRASDKFTISTLGGVKDKLAR